MLDDYRLSPADLRALKRIVCSDTKQRLVHARSAGCRSIRRTPRSTRLRTAQRLADQRLRLGRCPFAQTLHGAMICTRSSHLCRRRTSSCVRNAGCRGHIGAYDLCSFGVIGTGTFRGESGTNPTTAPASSRALRRCASRWSAPRTRCAGDRDAPGVPSVRGAGDRRLQD